MTNEQIKYMADRFLGWKLPELFSPDGGISFKKTHSEQGPLGPQKYEPSGTNLFDATQADAMVRHMIDGMPKAQHVECANCGASVAFGSCCDTCDQPTDH